MENFMWDKEELVIYCLDMNTFDFFQLKNLSNVMGEVDTEEKENY